MSQDVTEQVDVGARALARLATMYKGKQHISAVVGAFAAQCQQVEALLFDVMLGYRLTTPPVGAQLDALGAIVGQDRESADDAEYRLRIQARLRANYSSGAAEDVYTVFHILLPSNDLTITPHYPAAFTLDVFGALADADLVPLYAQFLHDTKAGGISAQGVYSLSDDAHTFTFSAIGAGDDIDLGFGNNAQTTGAHLAGAF